MSTYDVMRGLMEDARSNDECDYSTYCVMLDAIDEAEEQYELLKGTRTCHAVSMDCFGSPPYNTSGLQGNSMAVGCSECGAPWTYGLFRGNQFKHNFKACPMCGRIVVDE